MAPPNEQLAKKSPYSNLSFFLLTGLPQGSEFGLDSKLWTVNSFNGVKLLPPGLHLFVFSAAPSSHDTPETISGGIGIRHAILRFFGTGETVIEEWDNQEEVLVSGRQGVAVGNKRRRRTGEAPTRVEIDTVVSTDYLKGLDGSLAAYPDSLSKDWSPLCHFISRKTLLRVIGVDERGNSRVDAVMGSVADEEELKAAGGRRTWGKEREDGMGSETSLVEEGEEGYEVELLEFVKVDVKRSWPKGAVGEDLTRWSKDKSWCLSEAVKTQLGGDVQELLGELQLSFILFTLVHNFSSLTVYKSLFALLCRSSSILLPVPSRPSSSFSSTILTLESLPLYTSFLSLFASQIAFLDEGFFSNEMPGLDLYLLTELDALRTSLSDAAKEWNTVGGSSGGVWTVLLTTWDQIAAASMEKFGWDIGIIAGSRKHGYAGAQRQKQDEDEVDLEDLEEGEDAPVIVGL